MSKDLQRRRPPGAFEQAARQVVAAKLSPRTREAYAAELARWLAFCERYGVDPAAPPLTASIGHREQLARDGLGPATIRRALSALSGIYRQLRRMHAVSTDNPFHSDVLAWPQASREGKTAAVPEAVARAMMAAAYEERDEPRGARDLAVLRLLHDHGLRRESVATLPRAGVAAGLIMVTVKGGREEPVKLTEAARDALLRWLSVSPAYGIKNPYAFPGHSAGTHLCVATINKIVRQRGREAGAGDVHPHSFRAAWITAGYDAGLSDVEIQRGAHHADLKTTRRYDRGSRGLEAADKIAAHRQKKETKDE